MRLVMFSSVFPDLARPHLGPFNLALCQALAAQHEVAVVAPRPWTEAGRRRRSAPLDLPNRLDPVLYPTWFHPPRLARASLHRYMGAAVAPALRDVIRRTEPDAVVAYFAHPEGTVAVREARRSQTPSVVIVGGSDVLINTRRPRRRTVIARTLADADAVVTVSHSLARAVEDLGIPSERIHVIAQGIDADTFGPGGSLPDPPVVLWVGRMVAVKRLDVLIEAMRQVHAARPDVRLRLIGDGPERHRVERQVRTAGLGSQVEFAGAVSPDAVARAMRDATVLALTSDSEGLPNVLRESLASGLPFVSTDVGGVSELAVPGWSWLVGPGDPVEMATAITVALDQPRPCQQPVLADWSASADALATLVKRLG